MKTYINLNLSKRIGPSVILKTMCSSLVFAVLTGCGIKVPACSDEQNLTLIRQIFNDELLARNTLPSKDTDWVSKFQQASKTEFTVIRTVSVDEKIGKTSCAATLVTSFPESARAFLNSSRSPDAYEKDYPGLNVKVNGVTLSNEIRYTSQMTDDKKKLLVEVNGVQAPAELASFAGRTGLFLSKAIPVNSAETTAAPVQSADTDIAAAKAAPSRSISGVVLQAFGCGDTCQLQYADSSGASQNAICQEPKVCQSWADDPKAFLPLIGSKADLIVGKKYVLEGGVTMDNVLGISLPNAPTPSTTK